MMPSWPCCSARYAKNRSYGGKAQRHLEQAVLGASDRITLQEAHLRLAQMYEVLGQPEAAATHFRLCALTTQVPNSKSSK